MNNPKKTIEALARTKALKHLSEDQIRSRELY